MQSKQAGFAHIFIILFLTIAIILGTGLIILVSQKNVLTLIKERFLNSKSYTQFPVDKTADIEDRGLEYAYSTPSPNPSNPSGKNSIPSNTVTTSEEDAPIIYKP